MKISKETPISSIVAEDYRTAAVFEHRGIDFCCNGSRSIGEACNERHMNADELIGQIQEVINASPVSADAVSDYKSWPLDLLADYIEKKHHRYVSAQIPVIQSFLDKIVRVHGNRHPELAVLQVHFNACAGELAVHMKKEELVLFPFVRKMVRAKQEGNKEVAAPFGTVQNPIRMMRHEHDTEGERFRHIRQLSNDYTAPEDGCNTYRVAYATLKKFEEDLHLHIHLENNILFPGAVELEQSFV